jgi:hypothetical protein
MIKATETQIEYLEKTLTQHELYWGHYDRLWAMLEAHRIAEAADARGVERDGALMSRYQTDLIIGWVNRQIGHRNLRPLPEGPARRPGCRHRADRNGNCVTCGAEMADPGLR